MDLLKQDHRYPKEAYFFVSEALNFAQTELRMGKKTQSEPLTMKFQKEQPAGENEDEGEPGSLHHHISGQDLSVAARLYAIQQYGALAKTVLNSLGIFSTGDFGEIVYNMIRIGHMRKTPEDRKEDFDDVYDFDEAFHEKYCFGPSSE